LPTEPADAAAPADDLDLEARIAKALEDLEGATTKDARAACKVELEDLIGELVSDLTAAPIPPIDPAAVADTPEARLVAALAAAQAAFPPIPKNKTATVQGKEGKQGYSYKYADLSDVLAAVRPVLARNGLAIVQKTILGEKGDVLLRTELKHVGGAVEVSDVELGQTSKAPQQFGGALTYLRRYEATTLLGVAAEEDTDAAHVDPPARAGSAPAAAAPAPAWTRAARQQTKESAVRALTGALGHRDTAISYIATLAKATGGELPEVIGAWLSTWDQWRKAAERHRDEANTPPGTAERAAATAAADEADAELDKARQAASGEPEPEPELPVADESGTDEVLIAAAGPNGAEFVKARGTACNASYRGSQTVLCARQKGHSGAHQSAGGGRWTGEGSEATLVTTGDAPVGEEIADTPEDAGPSAAELEALREHQAGEPELTGPLDTTTEEAGGGTVDAPDREHGEEPDAYFERLRAAGCTCLDPLGQHGDRDTDDTCPIKGHGIPF
jgi:hypothetical protein